MRTALCMTVALWLAVLAAATPHQAMASCAPAPALSVRLVNAPVAFVGTVTDTAAGNRVATVRVEEIWKGADIPAEVQLDGTASGTGVVTSADRTYVIGSRYLFLPDNTTPPFRDIDCSGTAAYTAAVAALRPASVSTPSPMASRPTESGWFLLLVTIAAAATTVALATAAVVIRRRRRRVRTPLA